MKTVKHSVEKVFSILLLYTVLLQLSPITTQAITQSEVTTQLNTIVSTYAGKTWTNGSYGLGIQCYEYAHFVFNSVFSRSKSIVGTTYSYPNNHKFYNVPSDIIQVATLSSSETTVAAVKTALQKAAPGDYIQLQRSHGGSHSIIVTSVTSDKINYIDANGDGKNGIYSRSLTFAEFEAANAALTIYRYKNYDTSTQAINDGLYVIQSKLGTNKVLDVSNASTADSANVQLYTYNGTNAQKFNVTYSSATNTYSIVNTNSSKALYLNSSNNVVQYTNNSWTNQKWALEDAGSGYYYIKSGSGSYLSVNGSNTANGTNILGTSTNSSDAQKFQFVAIGMTSITNKVPMYAYIASTTTSAKTYTTIGGSATGSIYVDDLCTIQEIYSNGYLKVTYPVSGGTKTAYALTSSFFPFDTSAAYEGKFNKAMTAYKKINSSSTFGSLYSSDTVTYLGKSGSYMQVIYPISGSVSYKLAWVTGS